MTRRLLVCASVKDGIEVSKPPACSSTACMHAHKAPTFETYTLEPSCRLMTTNHHHVHTSVAGEQRIWLLLIVHLVKH